MSLSVDSDFDALTYARSGVPVVPSWTLPRTGLNMLLDHGAGGLLTVVSAPTGAGKTLGVASWVAGPTSPPRVVWLNLARGGAEPDRVWRLLRRALREGGARRLPSVPASPAFSPARANSLVRFGEALRDEEPWTVVLDGYPTGRPGQLGPELEIVLYHAGRALRVVLLCQADPALDMHRFSAAGELVRVSDADLSMDRVEITGLVRQASGAAHDRVVAAVADHTLGWACGVRRAAVTLGETADVATAMAETDRAIEDYLTREVLAAMTPPVRRLLVWTSVVENVAPGVVRAVLGPDSRRAIDRTIAMTGLVQRFPDGSLTCHALLRTAARAQLEFTQPDQARAAHERVVRWFADNGEPEAAVELSLAAQDWVQSAAILVAAHAVPRLVAGTASDLVRRAAERSEVQAAEPLLQAAVALARGDIIAGEAALGMSTTTRGRSEPDRLAAFVELGVARLTGRPLIDRGLVPRTRGLLAQLSVRTSDSLADLAVSLDALAGAVDVSSGRLELAAFTLTRGADHPRVGNSQLASADCAGQLALLEAYRGNLSQATARAQSVLSKATDQGHAGVAHAHVALAWVHAERGELAEARTWLDGMDRGLLGDREPWLIVARQLVEARVLIASGRADEAMRLAASQMPGLDGRERSAWAAGLVSGVFAEALLAAGEPQQALALVTSGLGPGSAERAVLTAAARRDIGDARGAGAALASAAYDLPGAPRAIQLQGWLLEARLAHERGRVDRTTVLVERVLRAASADELRRPLAGDAAWLRWYLDRDGASLRDYRPFVASLFVGEQPIASRTRAASTSAAGLLEPLTERETQVLELLAQMCSTEEIAAELFVSANTVKTHLKGIFRKYSVNRRVDAVRRGRELGLC